MNISIIIPNYNGAKLLHYNIPKVIAAVRNYKKGKIEIIIADDASSDNSVEVIEKLTKQFHGKIISLKAIYNKDRSKGGFAANVNRGVAQAKGDILVFLNTDVIPYKDFLSYALPHFADPNVFAVGCMDESIEEGKVVLRGRGIGTWQRGFLTHNKGEVNKTNTLWVSGGSGIFRTAIYKKIGGLNNIYNPFYWEDIDLSYRAQKAGYAILFEARSKVTHEHSKGSIAKNYKPFSVQKIVYRNMFFFVWVNITDPFLLLNHIIWLPYYFIKTLMKKDFAFWVGFGLACQRFSEIMHEREKAKKLFIISDKKVIAVNSH